MDKLCDKCGAYWECEHKQSPLPLFLNPSTGDTVFINGKEYEPPKLVRTADGKVKKKPLRVSAAQVEATRSERRDRNRAQAEELAARFRGKRLKCLPATL